jgi:hypothetical protein
MALNWLGVDHELLKRRGFKDERAQRAAAEKYTEAQLRGLLMERILSRNAHFVYSGYAAEFSEACDAFDVDLKALEKEHKAKAKEAAKSEEKKAAPAKAKKGKAA